MSASTCVLLNEGLDGFLRLYTPPAVRLADAYAFGDAPPRPTDAEEFAQGIERAMTRATAYLARREDDGTMSEMLAAVRR